MGAKSGQRGKAGESSRAAGRQRLGLIVFGLLFVLLFVGFAIGQGLTAPSVPSGDVAHVADVPGEFSNISEAELKRSILRQGGGEAALKPGTDKYEEAKTNALTELIEGVWLRGEAEELGVIVTDGQVEKELDKIKKERFPTPQAYDKFLKESNFTQKEVDELVKLQILSTAIQEKITAEAPTPDSGEVEAYYQAEKQSQFTTQESRDVRSIINEDKAEVEAAKKELEKDSSPASWKKVAAKYSSDPSSSKKGGLQAGIQEEFLPSQLKGPVFDAATSELIGPIQVEKNYFLLEVVKLNPAKTKSLKEAEAEIKTTLEQEQQQSFFGEFVAEYQSKWESRTFCADDYLIQKCANFVGSGHPESAPPACYEEDPTTPANECPAPVTLPQPALPGTVTPQKPEGESFVQRPRPEASEEQGTVVPGGGAPPEGAEAAPPSGE